MVISIARRAASPSLHVRANSGYVTESDRVCEEAQYATVGILSTPPSKATGSETAELAGPTMAVAPN
eukprot:4535613-Prymnesium_polylepis.1